MVTGTPPTEAQEIRDAQANAAAFTPLYERYVDAVYGYCLRRLANADHAADVTSLVFTKAIASIGSFGGASFRSWLFAIARNAVIDRYRTQKPADPLPDSLHAQEDGPETLAIRRETQLELRSALTLLSAQQQDVITLRLAGLTGQEIADATGLTLGAVKATQVRAFARLRELMTKEAQHV